MFEYSSTWNFYFKQLIFILSTLPKWLFITVTISLEIFWLECLKRFLMCISDTWKEWLMNVKKISKSGFQSFWHLPGKIFSMSTVELQEESSDGPVSHWLTSENSKDIYTWNSQTILAVSDVIFCHISVSIITKYEAFLKEPIIQKYTLSWAWRTWAPNIGSERGCS